VRFKPFHPSIGQHKNRSKGNVFEYCLLPDYLSIKIEDYMSTVQTSSVFSLLLYVGILLTSLLSVNKLPTPTTPVQSPLRHRIKPVLSRILHTKHGIAALARLRRISTRGIHLSCSDKATRPRHHPHHSPPSSHLPVHWSLRPCGRRQGRLVPRGQVRR
jgi:hypothetical protein